MKAEILLTNLPKILTFTVYEICFGKKKAYILQPAPPPLCLIREQVGSWQFLGVKSHLSSANRGQTWLMAMETNKSKWSCKLSPTHSHQPQAADLFYSKITDSDTHTRTGQTLQNLTFRTKTQTSVCCWKLCRGCLKSAASLEFC